MFCWTQVKMYQKLRLKLIQKKQNNKICYRYRTRTVKSVLNSAKYLIMILRNFIDRAAISPTCLIFSLKFHRKLHQSISSSSHALQFYYSAVRLRYFQDYNWLYNIHSTSDASSIKPTHDQSPSVSEDGEKKD